MLMHYFQNYASIIYLPLLFSLHAAALPHVNLVYYVLPESELAGLAFMETLNSSVGSSRLQLIRVITLSLDIPRGEEILVGTHYY